MTHTYYSIRSSQVARTALHTTYFIYNLLLGKDSERKGKIVCNNIRWVLGFTDGLVCKTERMIHEINEDRGGENGWAREGELEKGVGGGGWSPSMRVRMWEWRDSTRACTSVKNILIIRKIKREKFRQRRRWVALTSFACAAIFSNLFSAFRSRNVPCVCVGWWLSWIMP